MDNLHMEIGKASRGLKVALVIALSAALLVMVRGDGVVQVQAQAGPPGIKSGLGARVGFDLANLFVEYESYLQENGSYDGFVPGNSLLPVVGGTVFIDAVARFSPGLLESDLKARGLTKSSRFQRLVGGQFPIESINRLAGLGRLRSVRPAYRATWAGLITSQGDKAMRADFARASFGVDGSGVVVGTLSDSFNCRGGAPTDVATGDLPPGIILLQDEPTCISGSDEGRAIMQIIRDVAPGAGQAFHTAFISTPDFAQGILELAAPVAEGGAAADVIIDDVIYFAEPMFQDGPIAQAVDTVKAAGVAYFSSAGNNGREGYESDFVPGTPYDSGDFGNGFGGGVAHIFGNGDEFQQITVPARSRLIISFQWAQPFASVTGGQGATTDMDIYILDDPPKNVQAGGLNNNIASGEPVEVFAYTNVKGRPTTVNIMIVKFAGPDPGPMKYVRFGNATINEFDTLSGTVYGHSNAAGAETVGAAFYGFTPEFFEDPARLEPFSSAGPTAIYFETDGTPISPPEVRSKPEIVAPDGVNTTFFGSDINYPPGNEPDGFPNFFGTSASAPHAAAVAALLLEKAPFSSPDTIYTALENSALDMDGPFKPGFPDQFDFDTGFGLIQADAALQIITSGVSITLTTDGTLPFGIQDLNTTVDTTALGINDVQTVFIVSGPAALNIRSTNFSDGFGNTWSLSTANGTDQVVWEFSTDGSGWIPFDPAEFALPLSTSKNTGQTQDVFFRLTLPTGTASINEHAATVTIVAIPP